MLCSEKERPTEGRHTEKPCGSLPGVPTTALGEWEERLGHTDPQLAPTATAHTAEPIQRKAESDGDIRGRKSMATSQVRPLCSQQRGEKYFLYCNSVGLGQKNLRKTQNRPNSATRAKDDIKDYLEDISKLVIGRHD